MSAIFHLQRQCGLVSPRDLSTLELATVLRTAHRTIDNWKFLRHELETEFSMHACLDSLIARDGRMWLSPSHWRLPPFAQRLAEGAGLDFPNRLLSNSVRSEITNILAEHQRPQKELYKLLLPVVNHESLDVMIARIGIAHLFKTKNPMAYLDVQPISVTHPEWERQLLTCVPSIVQFASRVSNDSLAVNLDGLSRFGMMQVIRWLRNAFIIPTRFQTASICPFCKEHESEFTLAHLVHCLCFEAACFHAMHVDARRAILNWLPNGCHHVFIRVLLAFPKLKVKDRITVCRMFAVVGMVIHSGTHNMNLECLEIANIARIRLDS